MKICIQIHEGNYSLLYVFEVGIFRYTYDIVVPIIAL